MDFSSGDWLSSSATIGKFRICSDSDYIDVFTGECLKKNASSTTEILIQGKWKTMAVPKIENANLLYVYILLLTNSSSLENLMRNKHNIILRGAKLLNITTVNCEGIFQTKDLFNMSDGMTYTCLQLKMRSNGIRFHWIAFTGTPVWRKFADAFTSYGLIDIVATSHGVKASPSCRSYPLHWYKEFEFVSDDYNNQDFQIFIPSTGSMHPATSDDTAFRMSRKNKDWRSFKPVIEIGVCELPQLQCDKIAIESGKYNVTFTNHTYAQLIIDTIDAETEIERSEFIITQDHFLVVCSELVYNMSTSVTEVNIHEFVQLYLTIIGLSISAAGLILTFIIHCVFSDLQTTPGKVVMNLCVSLLIAQLLFLLNGIWSHDFIACKISAVVQHYA